MNRIHHMYVPNESSWDSNTKQSQKTNLDDALVARADEQFRSSLGLVSALGKISTLAAEHDRLCARLRAMAYRSEDPDVDGAELLREIAASEEVIRGVLSE